MKIKKGYRLRSLGKEYILVAEGLEASDASQMVSLNETAAFLWKAVEDMDFDAAMLTQILLDEYDVARETAEKDVAMLLQTWKEAHLIEE